MYNNENIHTQIYLHEKNSILGHLNETTEKLLKVRLCFNCAIFVLCSLILSLIHACLFSQMNNAVQMQPGQVPPNQNFLNRPPGPIPVTHGNVQQQVKQQCFPSPLSSLLCPAISLSLALCTHPVCISPRLEMECACCSKPSWSPPLCPSLSASVCGGGLALRQSSHTDGGPAETEQHGENQKQNYAWMHAHTHTCRTMFSASTGIHSLIFCHFSIL